MKYYGTNTIIYDEKLVKLKKLGYRGSHDQFRIICKAKSRAEANRIAQSLGLGRNVLRPDYTSETGNKTELVFSDKFGFIICLSGTMGDNCIDVKELNNIERGAK